MLRKIPEVAFSFSEGIATADADVLQCLFVERKESPALPRDFPMGQKRVRNPPPYPVAHAADMGLGRGQRRDVIVDDGGGRQHIH